MQNLIRLLPLTLMMISSTIMMAQTNHQTTSREHPWEQYLDDMTTGDETDMVSTEEWFEILSDIEDNPINVNTATREDLERIPFLTAQQIEDIIAYVYQYHGMKTLNELTMIKSLDRARVMMLQYFLYAGGNPEDKKRFPRVKDIIKHGKQLILFSSRIPFYDRKGDRNGFLGPKYSHSLRYEFSYGQYLKAGLQGAQNAGEPFFANKNRMGYDYYTFYFVIRKLKRLKALALGQYKLRLGMGLVMNSGFSFGKIMTLSNMGRSSNYISANTSRSPANYLQGAAATIALSPTTELTAFFSYRGIDATLNKDGTIATILKTGYHRTPREMEKKNNAHQLTTGGNIHWNYKGFRLGATGVYSQLDRELKPKTKQLFRRYYPAGKTFWNASIDYGYTSYWLSVYGETATGSSHGLATINTATLSAIDNLSVVAVQRYYSYRYSSLFSSSFSEGGRVQNESGIYLGVDWQATSFLNIKGYTDYAYFAWPRYQVSNSSSSWDNMLAATLNISRWIVMARIKMKIRQKDNKTKKALINERTMRGRLSVRYSAEKFSVKLQGDIAQSKYKTNSFGWMTTASGMVDIWRIRVAGVIGYFRTSDYSSRLYAYERGPLYSFSFPAFYGKGIRYALFARADLNRNLMIIAKCSTTDYFDRDHISSGLQQINSSARTDLELQLRWKF